MKTYKIVLENGKYNVYYYINGEQETKEFHSLDGVSGEVRQGYTLKVD